MTEENKKKPDKQKLRIQNLFKTLQNDPKSVFYSIGNLSKAIINKAKKSVYNKNKVFVNLYEKREDQNFHNEETVSLVTPFVEKKSNIDQSTLYSISKPFELLHADIADLRFLAKSAVDPKYCLLVVDLFTSKVYVYPMKNRSLLAKKLEVFYNDIKSKTSGKMRLQTDLEFNQNKIKELNIEFDVDMFHTRLRGGKAFAAEKKIRELKKIFLRSKRFKKLRKKRIRPNELIRKAVQNMNGTISTKYGFAPEIIGKRILDQKDSPYINEIYDFVRLRKVEKNKIKNAKYNQKIDRR